MKVERLEEIANSITHYIGVVLTLFGSGALMVHSLCVENVGYIVGTFVFSISLLVLYTMSGTYHILENSKTKYIFRILDHSAIYILIAGSYTPFLFNGFDSKTKWTIFGLQWGLTFFGIIFKVFFVERFEIVSVLLYLFMGWMIVFVFPELKRIIPSISLKLLIAGGVSYSIGVVFYALSKVKFMHCIWHLFVLGGSICHYLSVYFLY